jgi:hypothetical protein
VPQAVQPDRAHWEHYWDSQPCSYPDSSGDVRTVIKIADFSLSQRIGHADVAFTMKQYVQTYLEADRQVANTLADLIICGLLITDDIHDQDDEANRSTRERPLP